MGVSDPNSHAGQKGLVDPSQFARAKQSIQMACQNLIDPACTQSQVKHFSLTFEITISFQGRQRWHLFRKNIQKVKN